MNRRRFNFALSTLLRDGDKLKDALEDTDYATAMRARLGANCAADLGTLLAAVRTELLNQSGKTGDAGSMTQHQNEEFREVERLAAGARRTARLAFPGQDVILHSEFRVGIDTPKTLAAELDRAGKTKAACGKYATQLAAQGWMAADTTDLQAAIAACGGMDTDQGEAFADRAELTTDLTRAANDLYADCLRVQNAARLQYPSTKPNTEAARARFPTRHLPSARPQPAGRRDAAAAAAADPAESVIRAREQAATSPESRRAPSRPRPSSPARAARPSSGPRRGCRCGREWRRV